jgi:hypothetical protein
MKQTLVVFTMFVFTLSFGLIAQQQTADGGFIIAGGTGSYTNGQTDFLVYKLDSAGTKQWRKNFGGEYWDNAIQIQPTADGGYVVAGITQSYGASPGFYCDFLVYKLDAAGNKQWRKNLGGYDCDHAYGVIQTSDGGYLVIGDTWNYIHGSSGDDCDFLVYRLNANGTKLWRKNYGGTGRDYGLRAVQTADGGFAFIGYTWSYSNGDYDYLVYKVDASGNKLWRKNFGGTESDFGLFIQQTTDGGYVLSGITESYIHAPAVPKIDLYRDILVYRLDADGNKLWRKNYGGDQDDNGYDVRQTSDGGFVVCGDTHSYTHGNDDMIVYRVDADGNKLWRKNYGGTGSDTAKYIAPCTDGGHYLYGNTESYTNGNQDFLVYRLDAAGTKLWRKNYGGVMQEYIYVWD